MKAQIYKLLLLLIFSVTAIAAFSTVSEYSFASTLGTFTEISGGTHWALLSPITVLIIQQSASLPTVLSRWGIL